MKYLATLLALLSPLAFGEKKAQTTVQQLMQDKLTHSQSILKGLTTEDFALIKKETDLLKIIAKAASWHKIDQADFQFYYHSFENAVDNLSDAATKKNLEGAALSYMQLTFSCMQCHRVVRDHKAK